MLLEAEPCLHASLDVKFSDGYVSEHVRFCFRNRTQPNHLFYSFSSFPAEWFLHLFHLPRLGIVKKLKDENAQDVVRKALNMSRLTGLAVDRDSA